MKSPHTHIALHRGVTSVFALCAVFLSLTSAFIRADSLSDEVIAQIQALDADKAARTPAQNKMGPSLIFEARQRLGQAAAPGIAHLETGLTKDAQNRVLVDINATVSNALLNAITQNGGKIVNALADRDAIRAHVPIAVVETLAGRADVRSIQPGAIPTANTGPNNSQGDTTHATAIMRNTYGAKGTGVKVGVLSDGIAALATSIASGELKNTATFLPGQAGPPGTNEGTAMMEIVQDMVPDADIIFATGFTGAAQMATNIIALQAQGCSIIVDDVTYPNESPFQEGPAGGSFAADINAAVKTVSDLGVLFFSSAANSGNQNDGTSGTWEGDFLAGGAAGAPIPIVGTLHDFGGAVTQNVVTQGGLGPTAVHLFWSDPLGASSNDYDFYVLDSTGTTVVGVGNQVQSGTQDPYESFNALSVGQRIVIVQKTGAANRFLHLDTGRGGLTVSTAGNTHGHNASGAANAFSVAATPVQGAGSIPGSPTGPFPAIFNSGNTVELFSSDGPRRIFYTPAGVAITPGNVSSTGGQVLNKPDFTAADGGVTSINVPGGFNPFFGTSAAAPHAAGIAALIKSANPALTAAQIRAALTNSAIDIEGPGYDRDSGAGIIMANKALASVIPAVPASSALGSVITNEFAPNATGANDGTKFDVIGRGGYLAENGMLAFPGELLAGVGGVDATNFKGFWKHDNSSLKRLARTGDDAPETGATAAKFSDLPLIPGINDSGEVTLFAALGVSGSSTPPTTVNNDVGLWSELGGTGFQILIREGDPVPPVAGAFVDKFGSGCFATAKTGASTGEAAFTIKMKGGTTDSTLLRASITGPTVTAIGVVARENAAAPGVAGQSFANLNANSAGSVRMDAQGNICFGAALKPSDSTGLWYQPVAGGAPVKVFVAGDTAPDTTLATFQSLDIPSMGGGGTFCFRGVLNAVGDNSTNLKNDGIWRGTAAGPFTNILRRGDTNANRPGLFSGSILVANPSIKAGNIYSGWLTNNNRGAWLGWVDKAGDGISAYPADTFGVYTDIGGTMKLLVASGDTSPGIGGGATMFFIDHPVVAGTAGSESLAFIGTVTGGGTTAANNKGIWRSINGAAPVLVLRTGGSITTTQGVKTISDIDLPGSNYADHLWETPVMDATGRLLIFVTFGDGTTSEVLVP